MYVKFNDKQVNHIIHVLHHQDRRISELVLYSNYAIPLPIVDEVTTIELYDEEGQILKTYNGHFSFTQDKNWPTVLSCREVE